ncbi:MAG: acyl-CoA dehydrogenase family protein [Actinomycetota bacterium]
MDFAIPKEIQTTLDELDAFIEREIKPLEQQDDNIRFFDHRREWARTDFDNGGVPREDWEALLREMRRRADAAGWLRLALPKEYGGRSATNLEMAIIREHLATKGLGLHNDLQNESSIVGNFPTVLMMRDFGTDAQKAQWMPGFLDGTRRLAFGLTEPNHGSDATYMETTAYRDGQEWVLNGMKRWNSGLHHATHDIIFARTSGSPGDPKGITAFLVPTDSPGFKVEFFWWTFNMPTDHAEVSLTDVRVGDDAVFGRIDHGLELAQHFVHENRIRQAASSLGAAQYCINEAVAYANSRTTWGKKLSSNQAIQFPLIELHTEAAMLRQLIRYTAWLMDSKGDDGSHTGFMEFTHMVAMCNYRANRLVCEAADRAMQTCGGVGYSRHMPFEHIYRHHRRYRITEGAEEIQMRKVGQHLFGFGRR